MKNTMKRWFAAVLAALTLVGCQNELQEDIQAIQQNSYELKLVASLGEEETKTFIENGHVRWSNGQMLVFYVDGKYTPSVKYSVTYSKDFSTMNITVSNLPAGATKLSCAVMMNTGDIIKNETVKEGNVGFLLNAVQVDDFHNPLSYDPSADLLVMKPIDLATVRNDKGDSVPVVFQRTTALTELVLKNVPGADHISEVELESSRPFTGGMSVDPETGLFDCAEGQVDPLTVTDPFMEGQGTNRPLTVKFYDYVANLYSVRVWAPSCKVGLVTAPACLKKGSTVKFSIKTHLQNIYPTPEKPVYNTYIKKVTMAEDSYLKADQQNRINLTMSDERSAVMKPWDGTNLNSRTRYALVLPLLHGDKNSSSGLYYEYYTLGHNFSLNSDWKIDPEGYVLEKITLDENKKFVMKGERPAWYFDMDQAGGLPEGKTRIYYSEYANTDNSLDQIYLKRNYMMGTHVDGKYEVPLEYSKGDTSNSFWKIIYDEKTGDSKVYCLTYDENDNGCWRILVYDDTRHQLALVPYGYSNKEEDLEDWHYEQELQDYRYYFHIYCEESSVK